MTTEPTQTTVSQNEKLEQPETTSVVKPITMSYVDKFNNEQDGYSNDHWSRHLMMYVKDPRDLDNIMTGVSDDFNITLIPDECIATGLPENYYPVSALLGWCPMMMTAGVQLARSRMISNIKAKISEYFPHLEITIAEEYVQIQRNGAFSREYPVTFNHNSKK